MGHLAIFFHDELQQNWHNYAPFTKHYDLLIIIKKLFDKAYKSPK